MIDILWSTITELGCDSPRKQLPSHETFHLPQTLNRQINFSILASIAQSVLATTMVSSEYDEANTIAKSPER